MSDGRLACAAWLAEHPGSAYRFLSAAVELERIEVDALCRAGVPRWDAHDGLRRLAAAGEVAAGSWVDGARAAYAALIANRAPRTALDQLPSSERPREKAFAAGIDALDDAELVALLLRTGGEDGVLTLARRLLEDAGGVVGLSRLRPDELARHDGIGEAKAGELAAAFELARRLAAAQARTRPRLESGEAVAQLMAAPLVSLPHEELWCLPLDAGMRLIGAPRQITRGDVDHTDAGPRAFFRCALSVGAAQAIAVHNHPSGDATPSPADAAVTRRLVAAGRTLDLPLIDHVIVAAGGFTSLRRAQPVLFA